MATRALVGFINDKPELISTYNHYDGYPENLGKGLESHYSMPEEALKVSSMGYISYMDPETGEIEAKHKEPADRTPLSLDFDEAMMKVGELGDRYGADYIYIYNVETSDWVYASLGRGIRGAAEQLTRKLIDLDGGIFAPSEEDDLGIPGDNALGLEEGKSECLVKAQTALKGKPELNMYMSSLTNDIRLNGEDAYLDYESDDWVEDYDEYIADKSSLEEHIKTKWQVRAGIKK